MIRTVKSCGLTGIDGYIVDVEADISPGQHVFDIVGLPDVAVKESRERVKATIRNCSLIPLRKFQRKITVNLAPANLKKAGPMYDLPIVLALMINAGELDLSQVEGYAFIGELSLNGELRPVNGVLPMAAAIKEAGIKGVFVPDGNAYEAAVISGLEVYPCVDIHQVLEHLLDYEKIQPLEIDVAGLFRVKRGSDTDMADIKGQFAAKRALEIAAAGGHNVLMIGTPGAGKTMLARRLPSIMPDLTLDEAIETTKIHSVAGLLQQDGSDLPLIYERPFRSPHHTISDSALTGGGNIPKPGEMSLAHNGILFLDELPEFGSKALETLRQPLEDRVVTVARVQTTLTYPCNAMVVCAMNPCKCGWYGDSRRKCTCSELDVRKYLNKLSGPLMDRIDIHINVPAVEYQDLESGENGEKSDAIRNRVNKARDIQLRRFENYENEKGAITKRDRLYSNAQISPAMIDRYCSLCEKGSAMLKAVFENLGLSVRARDKILKVARTIADLDGSDDIKPSHLAEAIQYRVLDRMTNGNL